FPTVKVRGCCVQVTPLPGASSPAAANTCRPAEPVSKAIGSGSRLPNRTYNSALYVPRGSCLTVRGIATPRRADATPRPHAVPQIARNMAPNAAVRRERRFRNPGGCGCIVPYLSPTTPLSAVGTNWMTLLRREGARVSGIEPGSVLGPPPLQRMDTLVRQAAFGCYSRAGYIEMQDT